MLLLCQHVLNCEPDLAHCCIYRGYYELVPLLDYLTLILKTATNRTDFSEYTAHYLGQLNTTYVQSNPAVGPQVFATMKTPSVFIPVSLLLQCCQQIKPLHNGVLASRTKAKKIPGDHSCCDYQEKCLVLRYSGTQR